MATDLAQTPAAAAPDAPQPEPALVACPNCGAPVDTPYCGNCGQRSGGHLLSMREILADVVDDQLSVNGTLVRTVVPLLTRPGFLTREYLDGRILRYIPPFRTFLACMAVWLLAATWEVQRQQPVIEKAVRAAILKARAREAENARLGKPVQRVDLLTLPVDTLRLPAFARAPLRPVARRYAEIDAMDPGQGVTLVVGSLLRSTSRLMLLLVPVASGLLALVYIRKRRLFAEHFVFTLHLHAFAFAMLAALTFVPNGWWPVHYAANAWLVLYALLAMKRVYRESWGGAILHCALFGGSYLLLVTVLQPWVTAVLITLD